MNNTTNTNEKVQHIAVDVGYGYVKAMTSGAKPIIFPTLVGEGFERNLNASSLFKQNQEIKGDGFENIHIKYDGEDYFIGELASKESNLASRIFEQERYNHEHFKIVLNVAIQLLTEGKTSQVNVSTGLPLSFYSKQAKDARDSLSGLQPVIEWKSGKLAGKSIRNNIQDVVLFPQGASAIFAALTNHEGKYTYPELMEEGTKLALIDIGYRTTDFIVVEIQKNGSFAPLLSLSDTLDNVGVSSLHREIQLRFKEMTGGSESLKEDVILTILKKGFIKYDGKKINFTDIIEEKKQAIALNIVERLKRKWLNDYKFFDEIFLAGGGGILFENDLQQHFNDRLKLITESQLANTIGYYRFGNVYFNRKSVK